MASAVGLSTTPQDYKFSAGVQFRQNCFGEILVFPERLISWRDQNLQLNISAELDLWKVKLPPAELASLVDLGLEGAGCAPSEHKLHPPPPHVHHRSTALSFP